MRRWRTRRRVYRSRESAYRLVPERDGQATLAMRDGARAQRASASSRDSSIGVALSGAGGREAVCPTPPISPAAVARSGAGEEVCASPACSDGPPVPMPRCGPVQCRCRCPYASPVPTPMQMPM